MGVPVWRSNKFRTEPARANSFFINCAFRRMPVPALCTTARLGVDSPPINSETPTIPSLPTTAISAEAPLKQTCYGALDRGGRPPPANEVRLRNPPHRPRQPPTVMSKCERPRCGFQLPHNRHFRNSIQGLGYNFLSL